jgi:hypothetical protein
MAANSPRFYDSRFSIPDSRLLTHTGYMCIAPAQVSESAGKTSGAFTSFG